MIQLSKNNIGKVQPQPGLTIPSESTLDLPERVLQFGTGVLLRGLPDFFIDKANRQGLFNGRIVVVKSTSSGGTDAFAQQDGLYAQVVRGIENGREVNEVVINASISRVLAASDAWSEILACARNADMKLIISNTTEVGITLQEDDITSQPPKSFPGKLLAFLLERYQAFGGTNESGFVIVPTELIVDNGTKLRDIVLALAAQNNCDAGFIDWIKESNHFCSSLVDRIVPGKLTGYDLTQTQLKLGFSDDLMIMSEVFRLWAIECNHPRVREVLSFAQADEGVVLTEDLEKFRELKLRLLNGTHTLSCALACLAGFATVKDAMNDEEMSGFVTRLAIDEIAPAIVSEKISYQEACAFATSVFDRFRNPFLEHKWFSIAAQYSSKMKMRIIPLLLSHYHVASQPPTRVAMGFAAYLLLLKVEKNAAGQFTGSIDGSSYNLADDDANIIASEWTGHQPEEVVDAVLAKKEYWGTDLSNLPGFAAAVKEHLLFLLKHGGKEALKQF